jgi:hypothetical protein
VISCHQVAACRYGVIRSRAAMPGEFGRAGGSCRGGSATAGRQRVSTMRTVAGQAEKPPDVHSSVLHDGNTDRRTNHAGRPRTAAIALLDRVTLPGSRGTCEHQHPFSRRQDDAPTTAPGPSQVLLSTRTCRPALRRCCCYASRKPTQSHAGNQQHDETAGAQHVTLDVAQWQPRRR